MRAIFFSTTLEAHEHPDIDVAVYMHAGTNPNELLYASPEYAAHDTPKALRLTRTLNVVGKTWTFVYVAAPGYRATENSGFVLLFALIGVLVTLGLYRITQQEVHLHEALSRKKDEFIHVAGHELRTPVTSIHMYADLLARKCKDANDPTAKTVLKKMDVQIRALAQLIDDMLDTARIERDTIHLAPERFHLQALVEEAVETARAHSAGRTIHCTAACTPEVEADRHRIGQVLNNLLSNALKYSPADTTVLVRTTCDAATVSVEVQDFGFGIPAKDLAHVFDRYYRVRADESAPNGLGLGLYVSHTIMVLHGGSLTVESTEGKGSTFRMMLPSAHTREGERNQLA